jgi:excisionase family DNA binding protein
MATDEGETLSVPEAARVLGVNPRSLYSAIDRGKCPAIRVGRLIRIPTARFREHYGLPAQPVSQHSSAA